MADRKKVSSVASVTITDGSVNGLFVYVEVLGKRGVEHLEDGYVQSVKPEDRLGARVAVVMPGPRWRDDEVTLMHDRALAVDGRVGATALEHKTQRALGMPVRRSDLARHHELHTGVEVGRDFRLPSQAGVLEHEDSTLRLLGRNEAASFKHVGADVIKAPRHRLASAARLGRNKISERKPKWCETLLVEFRVKGSTFWGISSWPHNGLRLHVSLP